MPHAPATCPRYATHQHIFAIIRTMLERGDVRADGTLRICEIGCGDGHLINFLQAMLPASFPALKVEIHGFDVTDQGYADGQQQSQNIALLARDHPEIDWAERIRSISDHRDWGYKERMFDIAISNTVLEHVDDLDSFLDNIKRIVKVDGASIHFFPLRDCLMEGHAKVPIAHLIKNFESRVAWIRTMNRIGIGRYKLDRMILGHASLQEHAVETAKFIQCWTSYRDFTEIYRACYARGLAISYDYTKDFYFLKLRNLLKIRPLSVYRRFPIAGGEWLSFALLKYVSGVTLTIRPIHHDVGVRVKLEKAFQRAKELA
jgi:SAM-dependent methyltransferase